MSRIVFITDNSPEIRDKLKLAGFSICICASFKDSVWLKYRPNEKYPFDIHGFGYCDPGEYVEKLSPIERIKYWLNRENTFLNNEKEEFFDNVDDFIKKYSKAVYDQPSTEK